MWDSKRRMRTRMPQIPLDFLKLDAQKALVDLKDRRDNNVHGEELLYKCIVQGERLFDVEAVVVPSQRIRFKGVGN